MQIHQAYRFELDPSDRQRTTLSRAAGLSRYVWNWGLAARKEHYERVVKPARERGEKVKGITAFDQINAWNKIKATVAPWSSEFSARIPEHALAALDLAYQAWWRGLKIKRRVGAPHFKTKGKCRESFTLRGAVNVDMTGITLPRIGHLRIKGNTNRFCGRVLYASVSRTTDRWFVSLTVERAIAEPVTPLGEPVGIDLGLKNSLVLSTGEVIQSPRALKAALKKLRQAQKAVARSQRNSNRRKVKVIKVAKIHACVANVRSDWQHNVSDRLTREHGVIGHEDLSIAGMSNKKRHQGRSWADLGGAALFAMIAYKALWRGVIVLVADRWFASSQWCSRPGCNGRNETLTLKDRTFTCPVCGMSLDRDLNAALNLRPVAVMPTETLNARGGNVSPGLAWQIPTKREPSSPGRLTT